MKKKPIVLIINKFNDKNFISIQNISLKKLFNFCQNLKKTVLNSFDVSFCKLNISIENRWYVRFKFIVLKTPKVSPILWKYNDEYYLDVWGNYNRPKLVEKWCHNRFECRLYTKKYNSEFDNSKYKIKNLYKNNVWKYSVNRNDE